MLLWRYRDPGYGQCEDGQRPIDITAIVLEIMHLHVVNVKIINFDITAAL